MSSEAYYSEVNHQTKTQNNVRWLAKEFGHFLATRPSSLLKLPVLNQSSREEARKRLNPKPAIAAMSRHQWNLFFHGYAAWLVDSFDFFCVSISVSDIAETFDVKVVSITWGITLVLMLRSVGAVIFGFAADRWGRKWPLIVCYTLFVIFEIATGFTQNLKQFLAVRALFGISMGGCYPLAISTSLEDAPVASRGFLSGIYQPAYSAGFVCATAFHRAFRYTKHGWRALFWFSAAPPFMMILWRLTFSELDYFVQLQETRKLHNERVKAAKEARELGLQQQPTTERGSDYEKPTTQFSEEELEQSHFWTDLRKTLKNDWYILIYLILNLSVFNLISHGSQDLFPTLLDRQLRLSPDALTVTNIVVNLGGCFGGPVWGQLSEVFGRRLTMMVGILCAGAFIYPTTMQTSQRIVMGCGFMLQFCVMGAWGVMPIYLTEMTATTPVRAFISGMAYQVGNLASSASSTIEARLGENFPLPNLGEGAYNYGKVMCIFLGAVSAAHIVIVFFGPERFHQAIKTDFMLEKRDVDLDYGLERVTSTVPVSPDEEMLREEKYRESQRHN